jgi:transposase
MDTSTRSSNKSDYLHQYASLNHHPEWVHAPLFLTHPFFDPRDLVQVKYEMLRQVNREKLSVTTATTLFGFSRVTFYQADHRFAVEGLTGLLPHPKGPRRAYKFSETVLQRLLQILQDEPTLLVEDLQQRLEQDMGLCVHPRSIERALTRARKKVSQWAPPSMRQYVPRQFCSRITRIFVARHFRPAIHRWRASYWKNKEWQPGCSSYQITRRSSQNKACHFRLI